MHFLQRIGNAHSRKDVAASPATAYHESQFLFLHIRDVKDSVVRRITVCKVGISALHGASLIDSDTFYGKLLYHVFLSQMHFSVLV